MAASLCIFRVSLTNSVPPYSMEKEDFQGPTLFGSKIGLQSDPGGKTGKQQ
jgi:hypothetical protein